MSRREPDGYGVSDAGQPGPVSASRSGVARESRSLQLPPTPPAASERVAALLTRADRADASEAATGRRENLTRSGTIARRRVVAARKPAGHPKAAGSSNRRLIITLLASLGLHAAAVTAVLLLFHNGVPVVALAPAPPAEVELVMDEHKGDLRPTSRPSVSQPAPPAPPGPPPPPEPPAQAKATPPRANPPPTAPEPADVAARTANPDVADAVTADASPAPPAPAQQEQPAPAPAPPASSPAPVISLHGTDSPSDARAFGDRVIPAKPDAVFHNRPPEYPEDAVLHGQQGTVVVLIHVSPAGTAAGVDLIRSSGYVLLDRAAQQAVLRWHFLPAVRDGEPVASDMSMGFIFDDSSGGVHGAD